MKKISLDAGALTDDQNKQFGNYVFTKELLLALELYDKQNHYTLYLQQPHDGFTRSNHRLLQPKLGWLKLRVSLEEYFNKQDVFLAINQAIPFLTKAKKVVFCHGFAPLIFPELYPDSRRQFENQIQNMVRNSDQIIVGSIKLQNSLNDIYGVGKRKLKIKVLSYGIPNQFLSPVQRYKRKRLLLYVGSSHPIKNLGFLLKAFACFLNLSGCQHYKLVMIGVGTDYQLPDKIKPNIVLINHVSHNRLLKFYNEASCLITTSLYESFNMPVLEALSQNTSVVGLNSAIIPELAQYVYIAPKNYLQFAKFISKAINKPKNINMHKLREQFSWHKYVRELIKLYE